MFQHRVPSADNILSQAMRMTELDRLLPMSYTMGGTLTGANANNATGKERRNDNVTTVGNISGVTGVSNVAAGGAVCGYDPSTMFQIPSGDINNQTPAPFVILPRADLEYLKQEVASLKHSMAEFQSVVSCEIQKLRMESQTLKQQVESWDNAAAFTRTVDPSVIGCTSAEQTPTDVPSTVTFSSMTPASINNTLPSYSICSANHSDGGSVSADSKPLTQLLPNYDVYVNKLSLQIVTNEAQQHKQNGALFVLRRIIPLVFSWEELAASRGQGLNCKSTDDVNNKFPLDPTRVMACKAYMRKFCMEFGCMEPSEKAVNQTFNHQVNYSRRRIRGHKPQPRPEGAPPCKTGRRKGQQNHQQQQQQVAANGGHVNPGGAVVGCGNVMQGRR